MKILKKMKIKYGIYIIKCTLNSLLIEKLMIINLFLQILFNNKLLESIYIKLI